MEDLMPQSKRDYDAKKPSGDKVDSTIAVLAKFNDHGIQTDSLQYLVKNKFPDRFETLSSEKYAVFNGVEKYEYYKWSYSDSSKVMNTFYNWLDAFDVDLVGDEVNLQKESMLVLVGDTSLIYINENTLTAKEWLKYHKEIGYDENWNYLIEQKASGKARWYTFVDGKKEQLKKER